MKRFIKRVSFICCIVLFSITGVFAQESRPVIGLSDISYKSNMQYTHSGWDKIYKSGDVVAERVEYTRLEDVAPQLRAAFSSAIVSTKRFAVIERSSEDLDKIRKENLETEGELNQNTRLDFLLTGEIVDYSTTREVGGFMGIYGSTLIHRVGVSIKFTDVHTGQIVLSETLTKEVKGSKVTTNECCAEVANALITQIVEKLYPPMVLSFSEKTKIMMIPNLNFSEGSVVEVFSNGEELLDPYTGDVLGYDEVIIGTVVVYNINNGIAKAYPSNDSLKASFEKGMRIRSLDDIDKISLNSIKKTLKIK